MYRSDWELAIYARYHIAQLGNEHRAYSPIDQDDDGPASLLTQLRYLLGVSLIQIGQALAGYDAVRGLPTSPAQPAIGRPVS